MQVEHPPAHRPGLESLGEEARVCVWAREGKVTGPLGKVLPARPRGPTCQRGSAWLLAKSRAPVCCRRSWGKAKHSSRQQRRHPVPPPTEQRRSVAEGCGKPARPSARPHGAACPRSARGAGQSSRRAGWGLGSSRLNAGGRPRRGHRRVTSLLHRASALTRGRSRSHLSFLVKNRAERRGWQGRQHLLLGSGSGFSTSSVPGLLTVFCIK